MVLGALMLTGCSTVAGRLGYVKRNTDEPVVSKSNSPISSISSVFHRQAFDPQFAGTKPSAAIVAETTDEAAAASPSFEDSVRHKIGLNVDYDLKVGTPQIDVGSMQAALRRYETQMIAFNQEAEAVRKRNELNLKLATENQVRRILDGPNDTVDVGFWSGEDAATAGANVRRKVPVLLHPEQPTLADLQLLVPITLQIGGDGSLEDTVARRSAKDQNHRAAPTRRVSMQPFGPPFDARRADVSSAALMVLETSSSMSDDSSTDDVPSFEEDSDVPPFDDSIPDVPVPQQLGETASTQESDKN